MTDRRSARILGAVLGGAVGDAMGHPTEFLSRDSILSTYGPQGVTGYELYWEEGGRRFAPYTDDTQMAEEVLRGLLEGRDRGLELEDTMMALGRRFVAWMHVPRGGHRAPGNACLAGCRALAAGTPWREAGAADAGGCGSVMRAYPFGLVFAADPARAERWAVEHSALTHRDPIALAACAAMAVGTRSALLGEGPEAVARAMIDAAGRYDRGTAGMMGRAQAEAVGGVGPEVTLERLRGWAAHEAIAATLYLFLRNPDDVGAAILEGANAGGDSDSLASMAGSLVGARAGLDALPAAWAADVERSAELQKLALLI
ncbi:MAG: ADP-ribosylglycohydrolase family protein [Proteobacteria bacterium]|nr:ADP-ribosylglycohydrolase family protein [Pseudomonadota bacterium]